MKHPEQNQDKVAQRQYPNYFARIVQVHHGYIVVDSFDFEQKLDRTPKRGIYIHTMGYNYSYENTKINACVLNMIKKSDLTLSILQDQLEVTTALWSHNVPSYAVVVSGDQVGHYLL